MHPATVRRHQRMSKVARRRRHPSVSSAVTASGHRTHSGMDIGSAREGANSFMAGFLGPVSRSKSEVCKKSPDVKSIFISAQGLDAQSVSESGLIWSFVLGKRGGISPAPPNRRWSKESAEQPPRSCALVVECANSRNEVELG